MPGLFSQIAAALSGGDSKLVSRLEEFASGYLIQGEVSRVLALKRDESALLATMLAQELYQSYCASRNKKCSPKAIAHFEEIRKAREAQLPMKGEAMDRLEAALRAVAGDLANLARIKGKFESGFASVDGLTESLVNDALGSHIMDVKAAKRATTQ